MIYEQLNTQLEIVDQSGKPTPYFEAIFNNALVNFLLTNTVTSDTTITPDYNFWLADATSGNVTITMPAASDYKDKMFIVKRIDGSGNTVSVASSDNIDGSASQSLSQYDSLVLVSDGSTWHIACSV